MNDQRTDEELNTIIANWMPGWWYRPESGSFDEFPEPEHWIDQEGNAQNHFFCEDLNACHEAWLKLNEAQKLLFNNIIFGLPVEYPECATARQRAEALVRVIEQQKGQG